MQKDWLDLPVVAALAAACDLHGLEWSTSKGEQDVAVQFEARHSGFAIRTWIVPWARRHARLWLEVSADRPLPFAVVNALNTGGVRKAKALAFVAPDGCTATRKGASSLATTLERLGAVVAAIDAATVPA